VVAASQFVGGIFAQIVRKLFKKRTTLLLYGTCISALALIAMGFVANFYAVLALIVLWGLIGAALMPVRQAYMNSLIPSNQRATVLSFDSLLGSGGGVVSQPLLGRSADVWGYGTSYVISGVIQLGALPFLALANRLHVPSDKKVS
jgi:MFS family permease